MSARNAALVRDPVCGMAVDAAKAGASAEHAGTTYYFCCSHCAAKFNSDPARYAKHDRNAPAEAPAAGKYDALIARGEVPLARWGTPEDVGTTVATLAEGRLPFATGESINVGGGLHLHRI